jgi:hypothetical protein
VTRKPPVASGSNVALAVIGQRWLEMERAMGIENTAPKPLIICNQSVINSAIGCVRFLCEKQCRMSHREPKRALATNHWLRSDELANSCL